MSKRRLSPASRLLRHATAKSRFKFRPFLPDPMTGLVKIAAPPKFVCCVREQMLREHTLHQQKVGLSA